MTVAEILGCASAPPINESDMIFTKPRSGRSSSFVRLPRVIWEPCAGGGRLAQVLRLHGSLVIESDLVRRAQH
jgi:hypothetical protein